MISVEIYGGFHNQMQPVRIRPKIDPRGGLIISNAVAKKVWRHMCGVHKCICGPHHGWIIEGAKRDDVLEAMAESECRK